jgi:hypothetical protein
MAAGTGQRQADGLRRRCGIAFAPAPGGKRGKGNIGAFCQGDRADGHHHRIGMTKGCQRGKGMVRHEGGSLPGL